MVDSDDDAILFKDYKQSGKPADQQYNNTTGGTKATTSQL